MTNAAAVLFCVLAVAAAEQFCERGRPWPTELPEDTIGVKVSVLEAPLLSNSLGKKPGQLLNAFHVALYFEVQQAVQPTPVVTYTLEFDSEQDIFAANVPEIVNNTLKWTNGASYCFLNGLLLGRDHWTQQFTLAGMVDAKKFLEIGTDYMPMANASTPENALGLDTYSFIQVKNKSGIAFRDCTCGTGAMAMLDHLDGNNAWMYKNVFAVSTSHFTLHASYLTPVDETDAEAMKPVVKFYSDLHANLARKSKVSKMLRLWYTLENWRYVYRHGIYYRLEKWLLATPRVVYKESPYGIYMKAGEGKAKQTKWSNYVEDGMLPY